MARVKIDIKKQYREQLKTFLSMSNVVRAKIRAMFKKFGKRAERLYLNTGNVNSDLYNDFSSEIYKILTQSARRVITNADLMLTRSRMTKGKEDIDPVFLEYTTSQTAQNVVGISETTRKQIQKEINTGLKTGLSNQQISKNIRNSTAFSAVRATRIARTETHTAMNFGNQKLAGRLGLNRPVKEWVSAMDDRTRTWHMNMNGKKPISIDDKFIVSTPVSGGAFVDREMMYAGDPNGGATNVINCRCFVIYHDADDVVDRPTISKLPIIDETTTTPSAEQIEPTDFGSTIPEEEVWNKSSFKNANNKYIKMLKVTPALRSVTNDRRGSFYDNSRTRINMDKDYNYDDIYGQGVWRHEMGHRVDSHASSLYSDDVIDLPKRLSSGNLSSYYALEVIDDRDNLLKKYKASASQTKILIDERNRYSNKIISRIGDKKEFKNLLTSTSFWDDIFSDGKLFSKKDFNNIFGDRKKFIEKVSKLSTDESLILLDRALKIRSANKTGILNVGTATEYDILENMSDISANVLNKSEMASFTDFVGSMTINKIGKGHSNKYFTDSELIVLNKLDSENELVFGRDGFTIDVNTNIHRNQTNEMFANYFQLATDEKSEFWLGKLKTFAPKTIEKFESIVKQVGDLAT